ncbi:hypothetical protein [Pseudomonas pseudonitroreducens]|uniref:hypothetical protein n=1 Tax=Pseudomonas pseudonitroreducens TaxID=2892326 RepID=UPI001F2C7A30|nr:hypothetical protein [Pseudomonas pseudonitroreducens]
MAFYDEMADMALEMLTEFGRVIQLSRVVGGDYDPDTGTSDGSIETQDATVVILPASNGTVQAFDIRYENGTLIEQNLRALTIAAKDLTWVPIAGDKAIFDGSDWTFIGCTPVNPAGTPVVHKAAVKR